MDKNRKTLISEKREDSPAVKVISKAEKKNTATNTILPDPWHAWQDMLAEDFFKRLLLNAEDYNKITDKQVAEHYHAVNEFIEGVVQSRASGIDMPHYAALDIQLCKAKIKEAFQQLLTKLNRKNYYALLREQKVQAAKKELHKLLKMALMDMRLEVEEENQIISEALLLGLFEDEAKKIVDDYLLINPEYARVDNVILPKIEPLKKITPSFPPSVKAAKVIIPKKQGSSKGLFFLLGLIAFIVVVVILNNINSQKIEATAWQKALLQNTREAYSEYLQKYPKGQNVSTANENIAELTWNSVNSKQDIIEMAEFVEQNPYSKYKNEALQKLDELLWKNIKATKDEKFAKKYMSLLPNGKHIKQVEKIFTYKPIVEKNSAQIEVKETSRSSVSVFCYPSGSEIRIDGKRVGTTPYSGILEDGSYTLTISKKGYKTLSKTVVVTSLEKNKFTLILEKD